MRFYPTMKDIIVILAILLFFVAGCVQTSPEPKLEDKGESTIIIPVDKNFQQALVQMKKPKDGFYEYVGKFKSADPQFDFFSEGEFSYSYDILIKNSRITLVQSRAEKSFDESDIIASGVAEVFLPLDYYEINSQAFLCNKGLYPPKHKGCELQNGKMELNIFSTLPKKYENISDYFKQIPFENKGSIVAGGRSCELFQFEMPAVSNIVFSDVEESSDSNQLVPPDTTPYNIFKICIDVETKSLALFSEIIALKNDLENPLLITKIELKKYGEENPPFDTIFNEKIALLSSTCEGGAMPKAAVNLFPFISGNEDVQFKISPPYYQYTGIGPNYYQDITKTISFENGKPVTQILDIPSDAGIETNSYNLEICIQGECIKKYLCNTMQIPQSLVQIPSQGLTCEGTFGSFVVKSYNISETQSDFTILNQSGSDLQFQSVSLHGLYKGKPDFRDKIELQTSLTKNEEKKISFSHLAIPAGGVKLFYDFKYSGGPFDGTTSSETCEGEFTSQNG